MTKRKYHEEKVFPPLPNFLPGMRGADTWHIVRNDNTNPSTLNYYATDNIMVLPTYDGSLEYYHSEIHELLHAAFSPVEPPRHIINPAGGYIEAHNIKIAEEVRINLIQRRKMGIDSFSVPKEQMKRLAHLCIDAANYSNQPQKYMEAIHWGLMVWTINTRDIQSGISGYTQASIRDEILNVSTYVSKAEHILDTIDNIINFIINEVWFKEIIQLSNGIYPKWESTLNLAAFLQNIQNQKEEEQQQHAKIQKEIQNKKQNDEYDSLLEAFAGGEDESELNLEDAMTALPGYKENESPEYDRHSATKQEFVAPKIYGDNNSKVQWGTMETIKAPKKFTLPRNKFSRAKNRGAEEGSYPRYPHRMLTDKRVFHRKKRSIGGSVLIDDSGSMALSNEEVKHIILSAPNSVIAAYSGWYNQGQLVILGEDGKFADVRDNMPRGGNNIVDKPALEWLAKQSLPRIWVSDGMAVSVSEGYSYNSVKDCVDFCRSNQIVRVNNAEEAALYLKDYHKESRNVMV